MQFPSMRSAVSSFDTRISQTTFGRVFRLDGSGHPKERKGSKFITELRAGLTTFFTMAYIIAVNASIITQSGATCVCRNTVDTQCLLDTDYQACLIVINRDLITATAAIAGIGSFMFGFLTNLPVALAPGMGLNAYFTYQVVGFHGSGSVPYRLALTAVFVEGFIFVFLSLVGMRQWLVKVIPSSIKTASGVGIGLFLTEIGMSYSAGIGLITGSYDTPTDLGGCLPQFRDQNTGDCLSHRMANPTLWIGVMCGGVLTAYLMSYKVKSAIMIGIAVVSILSWPRNTSFTYFPHTDSGDQLFSFFQKVVAFQPIQHLLAANDWNITQAGRHFALALFTFLYVDIIDASATLYAMAGYSGVVDEAAGDFPRSTLAYCCDAMTISIGSLLGVSPSTAFIESGAGIAEGGRTGLTAMTTGVCFLISIFFAPIFGSIPPWATGCTLIIVGFLMMRQVTNVNWAYIGDALPAFVTIATMPLSYSVAYGLIAGLFTYTILNVLVWVTTKVSGRRWMPPDYDSKVIYTAMPKGGTLPWFLRAAQGRAWRFGRDVGESESVAGTSERELVEGKLGGLKRDDLV